VVAAKTDPSLGNKGISLFIVDRSMEGVAATKLDKLGWRASDTGEISFTDVKVPVSNMLGEENKGFQYIMQHFASERLIMGINAHARSEWALEYTIQYMKDRKAFGKSISEFQALRHKIAQLASEVEVCKTFNYTVAKRLGDGEYVVKEASMSKLISTKIADDVAYDCLQMLGGYGYMEEYPMARLLRDSRLGPIGGGTSEILREIIAKMVIDGKEYKPAT
jgi:alkylation response protein AidB-like acyl-CoA dehydrogenase